MEKPQYPKHEIAPMTPAVQHSPTLVHTKQTQKALKNHQTLGTPPHRIIRCLYAR